MMQHLTTLVGKMPKKKQPPAADAGHGGGAMSQCVDGAAAFSCGSEMAEDYSNPLNSVGEESSGGRSKLVLKRKHDFPSSAAVDGNGRPRLTLSQPGSGGF